MLPSTCLLTLTSRQLPLLKPPQLRLLPLKRLLQKSPQRRRPSLYVSIFLSFELVLKSFFQAEGEAKKEERPKSPGLLAKLLASIKGEKKGEKEKKVKAPKSPKASKKKDEPEVSFC